MPSEAQIEKYKAEIDKVMEEEGDLFNLSEDSPVLEEWSEAFKNNFKMEKVSKDKKVGGAKENITPAYNLDELKKNGVMDKRLEELVGGYNEMSGLYTKFNHLSNNTFKCILNFKTFVLLVLNTKLGLISKIK